MLKGGLADTASFEGPSDWLPVVAARLWIPCLSCHGLHPLVSELLKLAPTRPATVPSKAAPQDWLRKIVDKPIDCTANAIGCTVPDFKTYVGELYAWF